MSRCILLMMMLTLPATDARAESPQPVKAPATQPALNPREAQIKQWLGDLASADAPVRQMARLNLMSLQPAELPVLRKVCQQALPLSRAQLESLKEVVGQLYLASELHKENSKNGFVGVRLGIGRNDFSDSMPGIVIYRRIIGFVGYRMLQDGDIIVGLQEAPEVRMDRIEDFTQAVSSRGPGEEIHLRVIRAGKEIIVPIKLDPKPDWTRQVTRIIGEEPEDQPYDERINLANQYWSSDFGQGIDPDLADDPGN